jgi:hypothetical protein
MQGIALGQFVRALLAGGVAAIADIGDMANDEYRRLGVIVRIDMRTSMVWLEDLCGTEHPCWMASVEPVDPATMDEFIREWAATRGRELGYNPRPAAEASP